MLDKCIFRGHLVVDLYNMLNGSDTALVYILFLVHYTELRQPPLHPNPSCRHVEPRWKFHFSTSPTHTAAAMCRNITANKDGVKKRSLRKWVRKERQAGKERQRERGRESERATRKKEERTRGIKKRCHSSLQEWRKVHVQSVLREKRRSKDGIALSTPPQLPCQD